MSEEEWRKELFYLYTVCKASSLWPKNFEEAMEWQDDDAKEYLKEIYELDKKGVLK